jgi:hypothetical protein
MLKIASNSKLITTKRNIPIKVQRLLQIGSPYSFLRCIHLHSSSPANLANFSAMERAEKHAELSSSTLSQAGSRKNLQQINLNLAIFLAS